MLLPLLTSGTSSIAAAGNRKSIILEHTMRAHLAPAAFAEAVQRQPGGCLAEARQIDGAWRQAMENPNPAFLQALIERALIERTHASVPDNVLDALAIAASNRRFPTPVLDALAAVDVDRPTWATRVARQSLLMVALDRMTERLETLLWAQDAGAPIDRSIPGNAISTTFAHEITVWEHLARRDHDEGHTLAALLDHSSSVLHRETATARAQRLERLLFHGAHGAGPTFVLLWNRRNQPDYPPPDEALMARLAIPLTMALLDHPSETGIGMLHTLTNTPDIALKGLVALIAKYDAHASPSSPTPVRTPPARMLPAAIKIAKILVDAGANPDLLIQVPDVHAGWLERTISQEMPPSSATSIRSRL